MTRSRRLPLLAVLLFASEARAVNPGVVPPGHSVHGKTYSQWAAEWWKWVFSIPTATSTFSDTTGEFADLHQHGPVWFLDYGEGVTRQVTIPADTFLFFPLINLIWINVEAAGDPAWSPMQREWSQRWVAGAMDTVVGLECEIDGEPVSDLESYEAGTADGDAYMVALPEDNLYGLPAGAYGPSVDDGFYVMLRPLSSGEHAIHLWAADQWGIELEVTYELTIEEGDGHHDHREPGPGPGR